MTTISNLNIVVQQGGGMREAIAERNQPQDVNQMAVAQAQEDKTEEDRVTVQEFEESDHIKFDKDQSEERRRREQKKRERREAASNATESRKSDPKASGHLLDTIA